MDKSADNMIVTTTLGKTWLLDLDGTVVKHNGYKLDGEDSLLPGIEDFLEQIKPEDMVILLTSRHQEYAAATEAFLKKHAIRYNHIIYGLPYGERILLNDAKPTGREMAIAVNTQRDVACTVNFIRDCER